MHPLLGLFDDAHFRSWEMMHPRNLNVDTLRVVDHGDGGQVWGLCPLSSP